MSTEESPTQRVDVVVLGAGASGLMCASIVAGKGYKVAVLEHGGKPARKVLVSGGGKCNYTNLCADSSHYISQNPHFARSALARFTPNDALEFLNAHNIKFEVRQEGRVFLLRTAKQVVDALIDDCRQAKVDVITHSEITSVIHDGMSFTVYTTKGMFACKRLILALGGQSWSSIGASGFGYELAQQFGHEITEIQPGLVPFVLNGNHNPFKGLSGISFTGQVTIDKHSFTDEVLITHRGLSGPAILQVSSHWSKGKMIKLNLLPDVDVYEWLTENRSRNIELKSLLAMRLPKRLSVALADYLGDSGPMNSYADKTIKMLARGLNAMELYPSATEGFASAEVTVGGVDTKDLSSKTMESLLRPGLYMIGEVLDVTGELGGYNLQWAWASAHAAGEAITI